MKQGTRFLIVMLIGSAAMVPAFVGFLRFWTFVQPYGYGVPEVTDHGKYVLNAHGQLHEVDRSTYDEARALFAQAFIGFGISVCVIVVAVVWFLFSRGRATYRRCKEISDP
jgi:hypothetical protein